MKKIVFTGGGSAGHVIPNIAIIRELFKDPAFDLYYFGTDGIEQRLVAPLKIPYFTFAPPKLVRGWNPKAIKNNLAIPSRLTTAIRLAEEQLKNIQPDLVFSKGGFVALPVVFAAHRLGIPCLSHESDLSLGLANRLMKNKCQYILTAFPQTADSIQNGLHCGQPIRRELFGISQHAAKQMLTGGTNRKVLLVFGGGSGSAPINDAVRKQLPFLSKKFFVLHVCGKNNLLLSRFDNYRQFEFIQDMGAAYAAADVVVSRSGAGAAFECVALKKPTVFIPLEGLTRGDQWQNAKYFARRGLCYVLPQKRLDDLSDTLQKITEDSQLRENLLKSNFGSGTFACVNAIRSQLGMP
jgi:UDP-N-acetylglucosamine--N-acetylmuramyl-(pentapeptide) pyrophosphoryl-undecaprenol N-acetylglucosamine transferase